MRTVSQHPSRTIAILLLAGIIGLLVLLHVTSTPQQRCAGDVCLLRLI